MITYSPKCLKNNKNNDSAKIFISNKLNTLFKSKIFTHIFLRVKILFVNNDKMLDKMAYFSPSAKELYGLE